MQKIQVQLLAQVFQALLGLTPFLYPQVLSDVGQKDKLIKIKQLYIYVCIYAFDTNVLHIREVKFQKR